MLRPIPLPRPLGRFTCWLAVGWIAGACLPVQSRADESQLEKVDVFTSGQGGYYAYRIPGLVVSQKGTLLAFCEGRKTSLSDDGDIDMVLRRSTDGGRTWLPMQLVHEEGGDALIKFGNPCPIVNHQTGTILLAMNRSTGATSAERQGGDIYLMESRDEGATWSKPREVTSQVKKPEWGAYALGPGIGIQLQRGPHRGRLVLPANYRESFNNQDPSYSHVIYSDDQGRTWQLGGVVGPHTNECQVVEIVEQGKPGLLLVMRNHWGRAGRPELSGKQLVSRSFDGGKTWSQAVADPALVEPTCQSSLLRFSWAGDATKDVVLFSNPASNSREKLTVRASFDQGRTWPAARTVEEGSSAYSCLTRLADGRVGVIYERQRYGRLTFAAFPLSWLTAQE